MLSKNQVSRAYGPIVLLSFDSDVHNIFACELHLEWLQSLNVGNEQAGT